MNKNDLLTIKKTKDFIKAIEKNFGYSETQKNGSSHRIYKSKNHPALSIPNNSELAPGTRRELVKLVLGEKYYA